MMWKTLSVLAILTVGVLAGQYKLQGQNKDRVEDVLDKVCGHLPVNQTELIRDLVMGAIMCLSDSFDDSIASHPSPPANATLNENVLFYLGQICSIRTRLRTCAQQLIEYLAPCTSAATQAHIGDMKTAITSLFSTFCDDDMAQVRRFFNDGAIECIENKHMQLDNCTANILELVTSMPIESKTFEAIQVCYKYDEMVSCAMNILKECPKPSTREFMENVFSLFRSGTYCKVTVPVGGNEVDSSK